MSRHDRSSTFEVLRAGRRIREAPIRYYIRYRYLLHLYIIYIIANSLIGTIGRYLLYVCQRHPMCWWSRFFRHHRKFPQTNDRHRAINKYNIIVIIHNRQPYITRLSHIIYRCDTSTVYIIHILGELFNVIGTHYFKNGYNVYRNIFFLHNFK
jgi:hypothetical protein